MIRAKDKENWLFNLLLLTTFFNVWFPKAGIKVSEIPLTIGNILFGITFVCWLFMKIRTRKIPFPKIANVILIMCIYVLLKYIAIGDFKSNIGYIIPLVIYPLIFFLIYDLVDTTEKFEKVLKIIMWGFIFISVYSLLQYFLGISKVCIPGLTVNLSDYRTFGANWYLKKNNNNGGGIGTKIISTYQNGNLFGVNVLMIYPLVYYYLRKKNKINLLYGSLILFIVCMFLTLSRSCWLGIVLFIIFGIALDNKRITNQSLIRKVLILCLGIAMIGVAFKYFPSVVTRFTNTKDWMSMSGRTEGLVQVLKNFSNYYNPIIWIIGSNGLVSNIGLAYEMTPLAILVQVGLAGVILFYYILIKTYSSMRSNIEYEKSIKISLLIWILVGCIEGALWLPPTALNLFMVIALGMAHRKIERGN